MPKLVRVTYDRIAGENAFRRGLPLPGPDKVEVLGDADEIDGHDLEEVAKIFYNWMMEVLKSETHYFNPEKF